MYYSGLLNRTTKEVYSLSPRDLDFLMKGYQRSIKNSETMDMIIGRMISYFAAAPHSKSIKKPTDIMKIPEVDDVSEWKEEDVVGKKWPTFENKLKKKLEDGK